jgi:hypothetical protein
VSIRFLAAGAVALAVLGISAGVARAAPPACNTSPQVADANGDGHHASSDVLSAWFSEAGASLQAVIQVRAATFLPEHGDADVNGSGFALLFSVNGRLDYVRTRAAPDGTLTYDYGTYSPSRYFTSLGSTTGSVERGSGTGTTTIDIPAALGAAPGTLLAGPFALTYDGISGGVPDWVDHAPGGDEPGDPARGADYVVGSCGGGSGGGGSGGGAGGARTLAVTLTAPSRVTGGGRVLVSGKVTPARAGVAVSITRAAHATRVSKASTEADGSFAVSVPVEETTRVQALAEGIHSTTLTIDVRSRARLRVRHTKGGATYLAGTVSPALPGRALLLRPNSPAVVARATVSHGRFAFRSTARRRLRGAYQVVYVPSGERAERSTSNTARIR